MTATKPISDGDNYSNAQEGRTGNWMQMYSGGQFWPLDPRAEEVRIEDIAHALSNICRYGGHCERFYSVAEHSVLVSYAVPPEHALIALLHDATEAYVGDVVRPLKRLLSGYAAIERRVWEAIASRFGMAVELPDCVKVADNAVLLAEQQQIMKPAPADWCIEGEPADCEIDCLAPSDAEAAFLFRFWQLTK
ncbi:MAG TPA: hypothetical protein VIL42_10550 [Sphingomicrobium sp.]|jgi:hypothetical protein